MTVKSGQGRRVVGFVFISGITLILILAASADSRTLAAIRLIGYGDIFTLLLLCGLMFMGDALRLTVLSAAIGHRLPLFSSLRTILVGMFFGAITPLQSGMMLVETYLMYKAGVPLGRAVSIDVIKHIQTMGMLAVCGVLLLVFDSGLSTPRLVRYMYYYVVFFFVVLMALFLIAYLFPRQTLGLVDRIMGRLQRHGVVQNPATSAAVRGMAEDCLQAMHQYLHHRRGRLGFLFSLVITLGFLAVQFLMAPVVFQGLGVPVSWLSAVQAQIILIPALYFSPTPGGSGVAEGGFALLFATLIPEHLIGVSVILWRFFSSFLGVVIGGLLTIGAINFDMVISIGKKRNDRPGD